MPFFQDPGACSTLEGVGSNPPSLEGEGEQTQDLDVSSKMISSEMVNSIDIYIVIFRFQI